MGTFFYNFLTSLENQAKKYHLLVTGEKTIFSTICGFLGFLSFRSLLFPYLYLGISVESCQITNSIQYIIA